MQLLAQERFSYAIAEGETGPIFSLIPHWPTILRVSEVALFRSPWAPAVYSLKTIISATRPPIDMATGHASAAHPC